MGNFSPCLSLLGFTYLQGIQVDDGFVAKLELLPMRDANGKVKDATLQARLFRLIE